MRSLLVFSLATIALIPVGCGSKKTNSNTNPPVRTDAAKGPAPRLTNDAPEPQKESAKETPVKPATWQTVASWKVSGRGATEKFTISALSSKWRMSCGVYGYHARRPAAAITVYLTDRTLIERIPMTSFGDIREQKYLIREYSGNGGIFIEFSIDGEAADILIEEYL